MHRKVLLYTATALLGLGVACSKSSPNPSSPSATVAPETEAAPDGSTLKVPAPTTTSPTGGGQVQDPLTLVASTVSPKFGGTAALTYRFEVRSGSTVVASGTAAGSGSSVSFMPVVEPDTSFTWRVRAESQGAFGPWSSDASFRSPEGAYIRGNEVRDPMTIGRTVGTPFGATRVTPQGFQLMTQSSHVRYQIDTLEAGEFSLMVTGVDEGNPGDKTKILSMQEGTGDITANDYRFTAEKRGADYFLPGATTFRIITGGGDEPHDGARLPVAYSDERWYFWKATWAHNFAQLDVREDGPTGRVIYSQRVATHHAYRPVPHMVYLGAPVGRAGPIDASVPGAIYKNVYVGPGPRPRFPGE
jgi:hypothetical protein